MMTYREMAVEVTKIAGQELVDRAEELIPNIEGVKDIDIWIRIPSLSDNEFNIPEIEIHTSLYPKSGPVHKIMKLIAENSLRMVKRECCGAWKPKENETDVVEVVRCEDCNHWDKGYTEECCNPDSICYRNGRCKPDWFCPDGKRR